MEICSAFVGAVSLPLKIEITTRQCMNYAAAIGDTNPRYLDDSRPDGILVPPMLAVALTWPISEHFTDFWQIPSFPISALMQQVHYSESLTWMRPMKPGERLTIQGEIVSILPHRVGTLLIIEYTARDTNKQAVFIERIGGLLRGVMCSDAGQGDGPVSSYHCDSTLTPRWTKRIDLSPLASYIYDGLANIHFPIHTSPTFAKMVGLPGIIYQGTATLAHVVREMIGQEAGSNPARLRHAHCRFTGMVFPGTSFTIETFDPNKLDENCAYPFVVKNDEGKTVLSDGCILLSSG